jgi:hypothetical protein
MFVRALASLRTFLMICAKCSLKSKAGLMWTPSIFYYLFGGRYVMWDPSRNEIVLICSCSMFWFLMVSGFPWDQRAPVASHFVASS